MLCFDAARCGVAKRNERLAGKAVERLALTLDQGGQMPAVFGRKRSNGR